MAMRVLVILLVTGNISADLQSDHPHFPVDNFVIEDLHQKGNGTFVKHLHSDVVEDDNVAEDLRSAEDELQDLHSDSVEETSGAYDYDYDDDVEESLRTEDDGEQGWTPTSTLPDALIDVPVSITGRNHRCLSDKYYFLRTVSSRYEKCGRFIIKRVPNGKFFLTTPSNGYLVDFHWPGRRKHWPVLSRKLPNPYSAAVWTISRTGSGNFLLWTGSGRHQLQEARGRVVLDYPRPWEPLPGEWTVKAVETVGRRRRGRRVPRVSLQERVDALEESWPAQTIMRKHRERGQVSLAVDDRGEATVASTQEERNQ